MARKRLKHPAPCGGARSGSGRPRKLDKDKWGQITCVLRHDTIARLKAGAESRFFGDFLQHHLDRYPLPTRAQYLAIRKDRLPAAWQFYGKYPKTPVRQLSSVHPDQLKGNYRNEHFRSQVALHMALAQISEEEAIKRIRKFDRRDRKVAAT